MPQYLTVMTDLRQPGSQSWRTVTGEAVTFPSVVTETVREQLYELNVPKSMGFTSEY